MVDLIERAGTAASPFALTTIMPNDDGIAAPSARLVSLEVGFHDESGFSTATDNGYSKEAAQFLQNARYRPHHTALRDANRDVQAANALLAWAASRARQALNDQDADRLIGLGEAAKRIRNAARSVQSAVEHLRTIVNDEPFPSDLVVQHESQWPIPEEFSGALPNVENTGNTPSPNDVEVVEANVATTLNSLSSEPGGQQIIESLIKALLSNDRDFDIPPPGAMVSNPSYPPLRGHQQQNPTITAVRRPLRNGAQAVVYRASASLRFGDALLAGLGEAENGQGESSSGGVHHMMESAKRDVAVASFALTEAAQLMAGTFAANVTERHSEERVFNRRRLLDLSA